MTKKIPGRSKVCHR